MKCPDAEALVRHAQGGNVPQEREALRAHLRLCESCRAEMAVAVHALRKPASREAPRPRWALPWAAAAALLLAISLRHVLLRERPPFASSSVLPSEAPASPFAKDSRIHFGASGLATLREGTRAELLSGGLLLRDGDLAVETRGDPILVHVEGVDAGIRVSEGTLLLTRDAPRSSAWIPEAWAAAGAWRVVVLSGSATVGGILLTAGQEMDLSSPGVPLPSRPVPWRPDLGWRLEGGLPAFLRSETRCLGRPDPARGFVWEALVRRVQSEALFEVCWPGRMGRWRLPLGHGALGDPGRWVRVRLECRAGWCRLLVAGREALVSPESELARKAYVWEGGGPDVAFRVSGADLEVAEVRWRNGE